MRRKVRAGLAALFCATFLVAEPAEAAVDETGFLGIRLGTPLEDVLTAQPTARIWQKTKTELNGCYFQYSIPTILALAPAEAWLCEARGHPDKLVTAISVEAWASKQGYLQLVDALTARWGLAHYFWGGCLNSAGHPTEQYTWHLPSSLVRLINLDLLEGKLMLRIEQAGDILDFGPGVCRTPPLELHRLGEGRPS
ncbi:MAG: hypothetical protein AB7P52_04515 [Alphaproteobacteria bacterium]